ncbi:MAG: pyrroloquinoline quinone biosynthesis protein PqqB [Rhodobacteraceae bacterium]|nr:MAG: pyrroloquinoline quinone biosynthesis protein PqqB [Paracoccaceae bacterium]
MTLRAIIIGAAAGGGLPQWNCAAANSRAAWDDHRAPRATQSALAVTVDGDAWALVNASPDLRGQVLATPELQPRPATEAGLRNSPIKSVLLTNGDIDHVAGLLTLREGHTFDLFATPAIHAVLDANPIFEALARDRVARRPAALDAPFALLPGLTATLYAAPGKVPLYMEGETVETGIEGEQTVGVALSDGRRTLHYIPGCARMTPALAERLGGAAAVLFDGTVFHDDEMARAGVGTKTGARMGHMAMAGPEGSLAAFEGLDVGRKVYVHINNTNPVWDPRSPERARVEAAGWEVAFDGMEIVP